MSVNALIVYVEADRLIIRWHRLIIIDCVCKTSVWSGKLCVFLFIEKLIIKLLFLYEMCSEPQKGPLVYFYLMCLIWVTFFISELQLACVIVLVPHTVTLIMETASVSRGWLDHTVTSACWDTGVSMNMVASPASVLVIVTLTQETVWLGDYERFCWLFNIFKGHVFLVIFILYVRLQGISESTVVILYLKCKKKQHFWQSSIIEIKLN